MRAAADQARYVKLKVLSSYHFNAWAHVPQIRLFGRIGAVSNKMSAHALREF